MLGALKAAGGLWFGWSGETGNEDEPLKKVTKGNITWASFNLSEQDYEDYYCQFSNAVLWPAFHYRLEPGTVSAPCMGRLYAGECAISG
ncbi:trehalose-6-phosphate synthase [Salmonella enterica subsp. enterica serovar Infantis]